jgi:acetate kinase
MNILVFNAGSSTLKASLFNESIFLKQKEGSSLAIFEASEKVSGGSREAFKKAA